MIRKLLCIAMLAAVPSCGNSRDRVPEGAVTAAFAAASARGPGARVVLAEVAGPTWQRVYVFGPYTPVAVIESCLGRPALGLAQGIDSRDDANLLVFHFPDAAPQAIVVPRRAGDFGPEAARRGYTREAVFVVRQPPRGSWGNLVPADATSPCS
jgi:hypothetical protein